MPPQRTMISFRAESTVFQFRVAAVAIRDGFVLLYRAEADAFWALPGGRVEVGETSEAALQREMLEETGARVRIEAALMGGREFLRLAASSPRTRFLFSGHASGRCARESRRAVFRI